MCLAALGAAELALARRRGAGSTFGSGVAAAQALVPRRRRGARADDRRRIDDGITAGGSPWTSTSTRPRRSWRASACRCRAAGSPTAPSRRATAPARSAATPGWSRRRSIPAAAGRPAASSSAAREEEVRDFAAHPLRPQPRHQADRRGRQDASTGSGSRKPPTSRASSISASCSTGSRERIMIVASGHGGMEIEELAETDPDSLRRMTVDPAVGPRRVPGARARLRARPRRRAGAEDGDDPARLLPRLPRPRRHDGRDQPAGGDRGGRPGGARRQDVLRHQRALPPAGDRRAARPQPGGPAREPGRGQRPRLCRARRQHRLHDQRRRPRHGDARHDPSRRRRAGELPRHRRRRQPRAGGAGVPHRARATRTSR